MICRYWMKKSLEHSIENFSSIYFMKFNKIQSWKIMLKNEVNEKKEETRIRKNLEKLK